MDPPVNNWTPGAHSQQGSDPYLFPAQIIAQLNQLYAMLQGFYPEWCRNNPFWPLVQGRSSHQLYELHVTWTQSIKDCQAQLRAPVPLVV